MFNKKVSKIFYSCVEKVKEKYNLANFIPLIGVIDANLKKLWGASDKFRARKRLKFKPRPIHMDQNTKSKLFCTVQ